MWSKLFLFLNNVVQIVDHMNNANNTNNILIDKDRKIQSC